MSNIDACNNKQAIKDILKAIKNFTPEERRIIEKELVLMRLSNEFIYISDKLEKRRKDRKKGETENV